MLNYPSRIRLAQCPTPLQFLPRASQQWGRGHRLWVKRDDLTGSLLSGNKVRKLEFIAAYAQENAFDTLITCGGVQSNHCRATALVGAQLGLKVHLILRGEAPQIADGNYLLDQLAGASISCYPARQYFSELPGLFSHWQDYYAQRGGKAMAIPTGGSDGIGAWGYVAAAEELRDDFIKAGIEQAHVVTASGSGGTQAGLTAGVAVHQLPATVWGVNVCDDEQYFLDKVAEDLEDWQRRYPQAPKMPYKSRVLDGYVGDGYAVAGVHIFQLIADLGRLEGLVLDPVYTAKAFYGMIQEIENGRFEGCQDIVFMHTGGVFGVFPQAGGFRGVLS